MSHWISAIRPKTLFASLAPASLAIALAISHKHIPLDWTIVALALACVALMQIGANLTNDYFDYKNGVDEHRRHGPVRATQAGLISPAKMKQAIFLVFTLSFLFGLCAVIAQKEYFIIVLGILSLAAAYYYTAGPLSLSHLGLGEVAAFLFFGPVAVAGIFYLLQKTVTPNIFIWSLAPGISSALIMAINNLRDHASDQLVGKKTIAVRLGEGRARKFCLLLSLLPLSIPIYFYFKNTWPLQLIGLIPYLFFLRTWKGLLKSKIGPIFNQYLASAGKFGFLFCLLNGLLIIIQTL